MKTNITEMEKLVENYKVAKQDKAALDFRLRTLETADAFRIISDTDSNLIGYFDKHAPFLADFLKQSLETELAEVNEFLDQFEEEEEKEPPTNSLTNTGKYRIRRP